MYYLLLFIMKKEIRELYPTWIDQTFLEHDLMLGNDIDSLLSCNLLEEITNGKWNINYFYDFKNFYRHEKTDLKPIGVDMAFSKKVKCFDNHVSRKNGFEEYNKFCANPNLAHGISRDNYAKKYGMSTLLLIMGLYDIPLPKDDLSKQILLSVDVGFKGHFVDYFKPIHTNWLERLGFTELIDTLNKYDKNHFYNVLLHYGLNEDIKINQDGKVYTNIDLLGLQNKFDFEIGLPDQKFKLIKRCKSASHDINKKTLPSKDKLISLAYTGKNYINYTYKD